MLTSQGSCIRGSHSYLFLFDGLAQERNSFILVLFFREVMAKDCYFSSRDSSSPDFPLATQELDLVGPVAEGLSLGAMGGTAGLFGHNNQL